MPQDLLAHGQLQHSATDSLTRQLVGGIGLAAAVGFGYFLVAAFSVRLVLQPEGVAVFWPAAGLSSGLLIALGRRARWPLLVGVIVATVATHLIIKDPLWAGVALGLCNGAEALITAGLIQHYFGADFRFARVRNGCPNYHTSTAIGVNCKRSYLTFWSMPSKPWQLRPMQTGCCVEN
jgi:integral membrane sensor domain MASE1